MPRPLFLWFILISCLINPFQLTAQTSGPSQPEVQSFQAITVKKLVEPSTGEFQYNIPLFEIGSYPITLNYNSQLSMDTEASMVGLGFNVSLGAITRECKGVPDDFKFDIVTKRINMKENITTSVGLGTSIEFVGFDKKKARASGQQVGVTVSSKAGLVHNSYSGWAIESSAGVGFHGNSDGLYANGGIGINSNSNHGTSIGPYFGIGYTLEKIWQRQRQKAQSDNKFKNRTDKLKLGTSSGIGYDFNTMSYTPKQDIPFSTTTTEFSVKASYAMSYTAFGGEVSGYRTVQKLETHEIKNPSFGFLYAESGKDQSSALMDFNRETEGIVTEETPNLTFSFATPDVYNVAGHGVGGTFVLRRNNVFVGFDPTTKSNLSNYGGELELGGGPAAAHIGAELRFGYTINESGKWMVNKNKLMKQLEFLNPYTLANNPKTEQTYFKNPNDQYSVTENLG